jgi:hypothetical protein
MRYPAISSPSGKGALFCAAILKSSLHNTAIVWINVVLVKNNERLTKAAGRGASSKTVGLYGETMQGRHVVFARRSKKTGDFSEHF